MIKFQAKLCLTILKVLVTYKETSMLPRALAKYVNNFKVLITYNNLKKKKKKCVRRGGHIHLWKANLSMFLT